MWSCTECKSSLFNCMCKAGHPRLTVVLNVFISYANPALWCYCGEISPANHCYRSASVFSHASGSPEGNIATAIGWIVMKLRTHMHCLQRMTHADFSVSICVKFDSIIAYNPSFSVPGKPQSIESSERVQLSGTYNVRKGKLQLPVNRWTRRQVILCGTCLIVSSVKESQTGKMHILPLIGGKVCSSHATAGSTSPFIVLILVFYADVTVCHLHFGS